LNTAIIEAQEFNPWANLALEEYLLSKVQPQQVVLYLWQNQHTVVIGRNQNAWKECNTVKLEADGGRLARRLSGGGAVYHDLGNLNFTFIMSTANYNLERQLRVILNAVQELGIPAEFSGRNDLVADGRKFSGNAYYHGQQASYHHGTLLVDVDMAVLQSYLTVSREKMAAKGVDSVRSRVVNLRELNPKIGIDVLRQSLKECFAKEYGHMTTLLPTEEMLVDADYQKLYAKYSSWEWRYGKTPHFAISFDNRFAWGGLELAVNVSQGHIFDAKVFSDAMDADLIEDMTQSLQGVEFNTQSIAAAIESVAIGNIVAADVAGWLRSLEI